MMVVAVGVLGHHPEKGHVMDLKKARKKNKQYTYELRKGTRRGSE
jgi:hypothetical protein